MLTLLKQGWSWLTSSRKRYSFALALVLVGLLLWSRLIMLSNLPRTAVADDEAAPIPASTTIDDASSDKPAPDATQENQEKHPNGAPHASSSDETGRVSNSSPDRR